MQVIKGDKNPNLELGELMDGNTIIAKKITDIDPECSHIVENYNCTTVSYTHLHNVSDI